MRLTGNLKKRVDKAADIAEKRSLIEEAGMELTPDELDQVSGGAWGEQNRGISCPDCGPAFVIELPGGRYRCDVCGRLLLL